MADVRSMTSGEIRTVAQARAVLQVRADAAPEAITAAFRRAAKAAHPDRGGDPVDFRRVLDAYRLLAATAAAPNSASAPRPARPEPQPGPAAEPPPQPSKPAALAVLRISVAEAVCGTSKTVRLPDGRRGRVKLPAGMRSGDVARFGPGDDDRIVVSISPEPGAEVRGDDLWLTTPVSREFLKDGGRLEVDTPVGKRAFWISRSSAARGLFRAPGEGLPATETRPRGHLYLRLQLDATLSDSLAKSLLRRFAASWAA